MARSRGSQLGALRVFAYQGGVLTRFSEPGVGGSNLPRAPLRRCARDGVGQGYSVATATDSSVAIGGTAVAQPSAARHLDVPPRTMSRSAFVLYLLGVIATEEQHVDDRRIDPTPSAAGNRPASCTNSIPRPPLPGRRGRTRHRLPRGRAQRSRHVIRVRR